MKTKFWPLLFTLISLPLYCHRIPIFVDKLSTDREVGILKHIVYLYLGAEVHLLTLDFGSVIIGYVSSMDRIVCITEIK